jgi:hypothetical protein
MPACNGDLKTAAMTEEWLMYGKFMSAKKLEMVLITATLFAAAGAAVAQEASADSALNAWLGKEYTVMSSTLNDHMPTGGKLTFIFDGADNVVRICTRNVSGQRSAWQMDFSNPCSVTMTFTRGLRYCTVDDVKAGNAEVLSQCHRLRSRDVAMRPSRVRGAVELNDMIAFPVQMENEKVGMAILVDSPARVTDGGVVVVKN